MTIRQVVSGFIAGASLGELLDTGSSDEARRISASPLNAGVADARSSHSHKKFLASASHDSESATPEEGATEHPNRRAWVPLC
jgi:hypothetical protein